jgi:anti-sigma factor RsiW
MCPDRQILSLYHDGELPSPWKEKLGAHLASCPACAARLEGYRRLSAVLAGDAAAVPAASGEAAGERVWRRLAAPGGGGRGYSGSRSRRRIWARRVSLPVPAAAAAAAALVIACVAAFREGPVRPPAAADSMAGAGLGLEVQGIGAAADMDGVLRYLGDADTGDIVIIRLPESKRFMSSGEPAILKAADYSRGVSSR